MCAATIFSAIRRNQAFAWLHKLRDEIKECQFGQCSNIFTDFRRSWITGFL